MVVGGCRSLVTEHWQLRPEALGLVPDGTTFLSFPSPIQRSSDYNGPDHLSLMISINLRTWGSPVHRASYAVIPLRFFQIHYVS